VRQTHDWRPRNFPLLSTASARYLTSLNIIDTPRLRMRFHVKCSPKVKSRFRMPHETSGFKTNATSRPRLDSRGQDRCADSSAHGQQSSTDFSRTSATSSKAGMIFAHKTTSRSLLDLEHPDETSSRKFSVRQQHNGGPQITKAAQAVPPTSVRLEGNSAPRSRGWIPVLLQTRPLGKMRRGDRRHDQYHAVGTFSF
jgi:hypothetical protein